MSNHGLRRVFSLLLAVMMVCTLLPTAVFAEATVEQQPVVIGEQQPVVIGEPSGTVSDGQDTDQSAVPPVEEDKKTGELVDENVKNDVQSKVQPQAANQPHNVKVNFAVLYIDDSFNIGYTYKTYERNVELACQDNYCSPNGYNHSIKISEIKAAAGRAPIDAGYKIVGWSKTAGTNPKIESLDTAGNTYVSKTNYYIYIVAKKTETAPSKPTEDQVVALKPQVRVQCLNANGKHQPYQFDLTKGTFTVGNVTGDATNGYKCTVTMTDADTYVTRFNNLSYVGGVQHTLGEPASKTFTLTYKNGNWTVDGNPAVTYDVRCKNAPKAPTAADIVALQPVVRVTCTNDGSRHGSTDELLTANAITNIGAVTETDGVYTCTVTVKSDVYVEKFVASKGMPHTPTSESKTFTLTYKDGNWTKPASPAVTFNVACLQKPPKSDVEYLLRGMVKVQCTTNSASHPGKQYNLKDGSYSMEVKWDETNGYTCDVSVSPYQYVTDYNGTYGDHTYTNEDQIITLQYREDSKAWSLKTGKAAVFYVECEPVVPTPPDKPSEEKVEELLEGAVTIVCKNTSVNHDPITLKLADGEYEIGNVEEVTGSDGSYYCNITVKPAKYVDAYSKLPDINKDHVLAPSDQPDGTIKLLYDSESGWYVDRATAPVSYTVMCTAEAEAPSAPTNDEIKKATAAVKCTTSHGGLSWTLRDGTFTPGEVTGDDENGYTCIVTVTATEYVKYFNENKQANGVTHTLADDAEKTFTMTYKDGKWTGPTNPAVTFEVKCETEPETTYTVTYTDGVENEEVFADQVTKDLKSGAATPEFSGTPTRKNYVFAGWKPEVAKTVTADATYVAQWKEDFNNNGKPDDEEDRYTVTYKDGVSGKVFKDEVHSDLLPGVDTPDFGGKLTRKGYTFAGWSPKVSKTVTKDVTYTATWKATSSTGKDKVPKTGDSSMVLILGSVMLFSFCGATAVYVFDRKRKQG